MGTTARTDPQGRMAGPLGRASLLLAITLLALVLASSAGVPTFASTGTTEPTPGPAPTVMPSEVQSGTTANDCRLAQVLAHDRALLSTVTAVLDVIRPLRCSGSWLRPERVRGF
jgi:hypothetical protein